MGFLWRSVAEVAGTDFSQVHYADPNLGRSVAWCLGVIAMVTVARLALQNRRDAGGIPATSSAGSIGAPGWRPCSRRHPRPRSR